MDTRRRSGAAVPGWGVFVVVVVITTNWRAVDVRGARVRHRRVVHDRPHGQRSRELHERICPPDVIVEHAATVAKPQPAVEAHFLDTQPMEQAPCERDARIGASGEQRCRAVRGFKIHRLSARRAPVHVKPRHTGVIPVRRLALIVSLRACAPGAAMHVVVRACKPRLTPQNHPGISAPHQSRRGARPRRPAFHQACRWKCAPNRCTAGTRAQS